MNSEQIINDTKRSIKCANNNISITVVVCASRFDALQLSFKSILTAIRPYDNCLIIWDGRSGDAPNFMSCPESFGRCLRIITNNSNLGLSYSRNIALAEASTQYILFIDDDVVISELLLDACRLAFSQGYQIVGTKLVLGADARNDSWFVTEGQYHYLGIHNPFDPNPPAWGACLGIDRIFANSHLLQFRADLGRNGNVLASGDDTAFTADMRNRGARQVTLTNIVAFHNISQSRLSFSYLVYRVFWQGRSEVRRKTFWNGLTKELHRNLRSRSPIIQRLILCVIYLSIYICGGLIGFIIGE